MSQREIKLGLAGKGLATLNCVVRGGLTEATTGKAYRSEGGSQANMEESCRQREQWYAGSMPFKEQQGHHRVWTKCMWRQGGEHAGSVNHSKNFCLYSG